MLFGTLSSVTGHCIRYCSRMKKDRMKNKQDIQSKIEQINNEISKISPGGNGHQLSELLERLDPLETDLNKIIDQETAGL